MGKVGMLDGSAPWCVCRNPDLLQFHGRIMSCNVGRFSGS